MKKFTSDFNKLDLGEVIEMVRINMGLSMDGFASLLGVRTYVILQAEEGYNHNTFTILEKMIKHYKIKDYFDIKVNFVLKEIGKRKEKTT